MAKRPSRRRRTSNKPNEETTPAPVVEEELEEEANSTEPPAEEPEPTPEAEPDEQLTSDDEEGKEEEVPTQEELEATDAEQSSELNSLLADEEAKAEAEEAADPPPVEHEPAVPAPRQQTGPVEKSEVHVHLETLATYGYLKIAQFAQYCGIGSVPYAKALLVEYTNRGLVQRTWHESAGRYSLTQAGQQRLDQLRMGK